MNGTVALLREEIARMAETLRSLEKRNLEEPSTEGQTSGPALTMALSSQTVQSRYDTGLLPRGALPRNGQLVVAQPNPTQTLEIPVNIATIPRPVVSVAPNSQPYHSHPYQPPYQPPVNPYPHIATTIQAPHQQLPFRPPPLFPTPPQQTTFNPLQNNRSWNPNQRESKIQDRRPRQFDPIPMSYTELLPHLIRNSLVVPSPLKPAEPPYPRGYDQNAKCDYHAGAVGHSTENCQALKYKVQKLIDAKWLSFKMNEPIIGTNPLPSHEGPSDQRC